MQEDALTELGETRVQLERIPASWDLLEGAAGDDCNETELQHTEMASNDAQLMVISPDNTLALHQTQRKEEAELCILLLGHSEATTCPHRPHQTFYSLAEGMEMKAK
jgi:hypothetical protein